MVLDHTEAKAGETVGVGHKNRRDVSVLCSPEQLLQSSALVGKSRCHIAERGENHTSFCCSFEVLDLAHEIVLLPGTRDARVDEHASAPVLVLSMKSVQVRYTEHPMAAR